MANSNVEKLPSWMIGWFVFGGLVQLWDAFFILLRPHSMPPDGKWSVVWWPYNIYKEVDLNYKNVDDCFTMAVSMMNVVEVATMFYLVAVNSSRHAKTDLVALIANIMTLWKTVLYLLMYTPLARGTHLLGTDDPVKLLFLFAIPNGIWILLPALGALQLFNRILERLTATPVVVKQTKRKPKQY